MEKIKSSDIKLGMKFTAPVFFDDGTNMFIAERQPIKQIHLNALIRWKIPFVITYGKIMVEDEEDEIEELEDLDDLEEAEAAEAHINPFLTKIAENLTKVNPEIKEIYKKSLQKVNQFFASLDRNMPISRSDVDILIDNVYSLIFPDSSESIGYILSLPQNNDYGKSALNTAIISGALAILDGFTKRQVQQVIAAAIFHDIGMLKTSDQIIQKKTQLSKNEYNMVKLHPMRSGRYVSEILFFPNEVAQIIQQHHESWDGTGYPDAIRGEAIEKGARILSVADTFVAMISKKNYRDPMLSYDATKALMEGSGKKFDPEVVKNFIKIIGVYPLKSIVLLSNNLVAQVVQANIDDPLLPEVKILTAESAISDKFALGDIIKLKDNPKITIIKVLDPNDFKN